MDYFQPAAKPFAGHRKMTGECRQGSRTPMLRGRKGLPKYTPLAKKILLKKYVNKMLVVLLTNQKDYALTKSV